MDHNFFAYQRRALRPLLRWGMGSSVVGVGLALLPSDYWRQMGLQAAAWGVIDAALAFAGRRSALLKAERSFAGDLSEAKEHAEADQFRRILLVNAGLDVLYIVAGLATAQYYADRPDRRGLGHGIAVQGLFLLIFDSLLARDVGARWL
ncbi:hypothetical protein K2Z83_06430 [Oscillochloris sp. ZM17-4]|uniref:DUF6992 family protein n=1 Tax=Oscillochloris sp. ZM17-4 TaxID=2866714 RepID=UPI001C72CD4C|nr:hypothetical protein [Oscillochloris sp. ZM17-4]MBX0327313.1 hypothetical protein [Oscillochloris sp. ZM17-4]